VVLLEAVDDSFFSFFYFVLLFLSVFVPSTSLFLLFLTVKVLLLKIGRIVAAGGGYVDDRWFAMVILLFSSTSLCFFFLVFFCSLCQQGFSNLCSGFVSSAWPLMKVLIVTIKVSICVLRCSFHLVCFHHCLLLSIINHCNFLWRTCICSSTSPPFILLFSTIVDYLRINATFLWSWKVTLIPIC